jgi:hypothetical protein
MGTHTTGAGVAEDLARGHWEAPYLRAALRKLPPAVRSGRLIDVLAPAAEAFDHTETDQDTMLHLRTLVDALTATP